MQQTAAERTEYVDFWNDVLVPKFVRWKHVLVDGLSHHSAAVFPRLAVPEGGRVVDVGCGFGDTAIELAKRVGPAGYVLGIDCCDGFLDYGRRDAAAAGIGNVEFARGRRADLSVRGRLRPLLLALRHAVLREPGGGAPEHAAGACSRAARW